MQKKNIKSLICLLFISLLATTFLSCATKRTERVSTSEPTSFRVSGRYYFFDDVLIPRELNYKQSRSFIYETPRFKAGVLVFTKWWLDPNSLIDFFIYNMERDNWKLLNSFKGKESFLNFTKPDKTCTIRIIEKWNGMTEVEVRVGPIGEKKM